jgi:hypothetical protein
MLNISAARRVHFGHRDWPLTVLETALRGLEDRRPFRRLRNSEVILKRLGKHKRL